MKPVDAGVVQDEPEVSADVHVEATSARPRRRPLLGRLSAVVVGAVVVASVIYFLPDEGSAPLPSSRLSIVAPQDGVLWTENKNILITPDGSTLVYTVAYQGSKRIYARALNDLEAKEIPAVLDERFIRPFISPDGTRIGFFGLNRQDMLAEREAGERGEEYFHPGARLKVVSLTDGEIATLCAPCGPYIGAGRGAAGGTWAPDGTIVFADGSRLMRISEGGGEPQVIPTAATEYPRGS